ncbi:MAG TPA: hypothetical protein PLF71_03890 [bacterium]|nr:hypothetical protein [bacterium]
MKHMIVSAGIAGLVILASCAGNRHQGTYSSAVVMTGQEAYATSDLPAECANAPTQENIMNGGELIMVKCSCHQNGRLAEWYNTVNPQIDPSNYCHAPFNGLVFRSNVTATVSTPAASTSSTPPATSAPPPAVTASGSAPAPVPPPVSSSIQVTDLKYNCNGPVASREYKTIEERAGSRTSTAISQQCVGQGFTCLTDPAQQRDTSQPPCACADGLRLVILSGQHRTWGCQSL